MKTTSRITMIMTIRISSVNPTINPVLVLEAGNMRQHYTMLLCIHSVHTSAAIIANNISEKAHILKFSYIYRMLASEVNFASN